MWWQLTSRDKNFGGRSVHWVTDAPRIVCLSLSHFTPLFLSHPPLYIVPVPAGTGTMTSNEYLSFAASSSVLQAARLLVSSSHWSLLWPAGDLTLALNSQTINPTGRETASAASPTQTSFSLAFCFPYIRSKLGDCLNGWEICVKGCVKTSALFPFITFNKSNWANRL